MNQSPFLGPIFEGFVASEILKYQLASGRAKALYYFRDQQGLEVDFLVPLSEKRLLLLESKASKTITPAMAGPLARLRRAISRYDTTSYLVHRGSKEGPGFTAVQPGIKALSVENLNELITKGSRLKAR